jgi:hypothetical protein
MYVKLKYALCVEEENVKGEDGGEEGGVFIRGRNFSQLRSSTGSRFKIDAQFPWQNSMPFSYRDRSLKQVPKYTKIPASGFPKINLTDIVCRFCSPMSMDKFLLTFSNM